eukprot:5774089-Amphidinium_carterae.1
MSQVMDQGCDEEVDTIGVDEYSRLFDNYQYVKVMGGSPDEAEECTMDRVARLKHALEHRRPPYADFGIFTPYGDRLQRKLRMTGFALQTDGSLKNTEVPGPPTLSDWDVSYRVLRAALLCLGAVCLAHIEQYRNHLVRLHTRYGAQAWVLI